MMALFRSQLHQDIWIEHHCERCARMPGPCPIITKVLMSDNPRKPVEWERNTRSGALMAETIKCNMEVRKLPSLSRPVVNEDVPMFDVESVAGPMDSDHA